MHSNISVHNNYRFCTSTSYLEVMPVSVYSFSFSPCVLSDNKCIGLMAPSTPSNGLLQHGIVTWCTCLQCLLISLEVVRSVLVSDNNNIKHEVIYPHTSLANSPELKMP